LKRSLKARLKSRRRMPSSASRRMFPPSRMGMGKRFKIPRLRLIIAIRLMTSTGPSCTAWPASTAMPTKLCNCRTESFPEKSLPIIPNNLRVASAVSSEASLTVSVSEASEETADATRKLFGIIGRLFSGKLSVRQLQSFVGIAVLAGQAVQEGPVDVINLMAMISLNLGILNLLPIPILDGGNILLLALEGIRRRDFSLAFKERFVQVGLVFLLVLFAYVMYNDVVRLLPTHS